MAIKVTPDMTLRDFLALGATWIGYGSERRGDISLWLWSVSPPRYVVETARDGGIPVSDSTNLQACLDTLMQDWGEG